ncbi:dihydrofolate reductase family protein [Roseibium sp. MMSF_3544]|uniref:dihydrofolate reductase family protein n=1 Tax=unclassified Roseibium TaxID=2629323 RepID=UPI00273ECEAD|nr:dihydrofolate reductase family protein [Roseibium sp. MMSF_3544]
MRDLAILTFVTLDGVMQAPSMPDEDRSRSFDLGGWAAPFWEGVMEQVQREAMAMPYDMLFGRKTYDLFAGHWPDTDDDPIADMMTAARKYVVTSSTSGLTWNNSQAVSGDLTREIAKLKHEDGPLLQVHGSWQLIQFLLAEGLIDEFRIWTFPVVLGSGKRLFESGARPLKLKLQKSEALADGTVMSLFKRG